ncbi:DUF6394 family protein [Candidatus Halobeggiatoa sp. HSG11]|nr:DUF6394 family protein [Candidatus Halobeggiatoa sp. HSG11]
MNLEKVIFGFFIVMALTLNFGFFIGDVDNPEHHHVYELAAAIFVNLVATILKFGDRSQVGAVLFATSLVADLQLIIAALVWGINTEMTPSIMASIVSLAGGAMLANIISVLLLVFEIMLLRR